MLTNTAQSGDPAKRARSIVQAVSNKLDLSIGSINSV